jgi:hypothetical protein
MAKGLQRLACLARLKANLGSSLVKDLIRKNGKIIIITIMINLEKSFSYLVFLNGLTFLADLPGLGLLV